MELCAALPAASLLRRVLAGDLENTTCALCLCVESLMPSTLPVTLDTGQTISVEQLANDLQLEKADLQPTKICNLCINQMKSFYIFKKKCLRTKTYLQNFIETLDKDTTVASIQLIELYPDDAFKSVETMSLHILSNLKAFNNILSEQTDHQEQYKRLQENLLTFAKFICDYCRYSFTNKQHLHMHISRKHSSVLNLTDAEYSIEKLDYERCQGNTTKNKYKNIEIPHENIEIPHEKYKGADIKEQVPNIPDPLDTDPLESIHGVNRNLTQQIKKETEVFECRKCATDLPSFDELYNHLKEHKHSPYHTCRHCDHRCKGLSQLLVHWEDVHSEMPPLTPLVLIQRNRLFLCSLCKEKFNSQFELKSHIYNHHATRDEVECPDCYASFANQWALSIHKCQGDMLNATKEIIKEENELEDTFGDTFDVNKSIESDVSNSSFKAPKVQIIKETDSSETINLEANNESQKNTKTYLSTETLSLKGNKSQEIRETYSSLKSNKLQIREKNDLSQSTNLIDSAKKYNKIIKDDLSLIQSNPSLQATRARIIAEVKKEVQSKLYPDNKKYPCKQCILVLKSHQSLLNHQLLEHNITGETKYPCKVCNKDFKTKTALNVHNFVLHVEGKTCDVCKIQYGTNHTCKFACPECTEFLCVHRPYLEAFFKADKENPSSKHQCVGCSYEYSKKHDLIKHINRYHVSGLTHSCDDCDIQCPSVKALRFHRITRHPSRLCPHCNKSIKNSMFKKHIVRCMEMTKPFSCNICNKRFTSDDEVQVHTKNPVPCIRSKLRYPCAKCNKFLPSKKAKVKHEKSHPPDANVLCPVCNKTYGTREERSVCLNTHKDDVSGVCPVCEIFFNHLQKHLKIHSKRETVDRAKAMSENKLRKVYMCDVCGSMHHSPRELEDHKERHVNQEKCPICSKMVWKKFMNKHVDIHRTLKPKLQCPDCHFSTLAVRTYERHLSSFHGRVKPFKCATCGKKFCAKESLTKHKALHKVVSVSCVVCEKKFRSIRTHQLHMMKHDGLLKFPCQQCGKRFATAAVRNNHQVTVHAKPKLKCSLCKEAFYSSMDLRKHMRKDHKATSKIRN